MAQPSQQVAARMGRLGREVANAEKASVQRAALQAKNAHLAALRAATGGDLRMSGVGKKGARVGARYRVLRSGAVLVTAEGPVHLLERPSEPHMIIPRSVGRAKGRTKVARRQAKQELYDALFGGQYGEAKPLRMPWGPRMSARHPGVRNPSRAWSKGFSRARPVVDRTIKQQYGAAFARSMRG